MCIVIYWYVCLFLVTDEGGDSWKFSLRVSTLKTAMLTLMLLVANLANTKCFTNNEKWHMALAHGNSSRVLS